MTITHNGEICTSADTASDFTTLNGGANISGDDAFVEGTGAVGDKMSAANEVLVSDTLSGGASGVYDFSSGGADEGKHVIGWANSKSVLQATGGLQIYLGNASGHNGQYYVDPANYTGGFILKVVDPARDMDTAATWTTTGNPAQLDDVSRIGFEFDVQGSVMGSFNNVQIDQMCVGFGIRAASNRITFNAQSDVNDTTEVITVTSHGWPHGTPVYYDNEGGTDIGGLTSGTIYYINADGTNTVSLHNTRADALTDTSPINLTDGSSETHSLTPAYQMEDIRVYDQDTNFFGWWSSAQGANIGRGKLHLGPASGNAESRFKDSAFSIIFADELVATGFYEIEMLGTDTLVEWDLATFASANPDNAFNRWDLNADGTFGNTSGFGLIANNCVFKQMGQASLNANATFTGCTFIDCDNISLGGGSLVSCIFLDPNLTTNEAFISTNDLDLLNGCTFESNASGGHAVDMGTIAANDTQGWNCNTSGYAVSDGSTGDETILVSVNSGITLTINVAAGASTPSIKNDGPGTVTVVAGQVTLTVKCVDVTDSSNIQNARVYVTAAAGGPLSEGTVIIDKVLTDVNGEAADTRSYASNQPIVGVARKGSTSTFYKNAPISGTIDNGAGLSLTVQMIPDE